MIRLILERLDSTGCAYAGEEKAKQTFHTFDVDLPEVEAMMQTAEFVNVRFVGAELLADAEVQTKLVG